jgi:hypothetical protein
MRTKRLGIVLSLAACFTLGCLDSGGGNQDQWMNTDAYVGPEVSTSGDDGGVTCGDGPSFGSPTRLSDDVEPDGGVVHIQYHVAMAASSSDAGAAVNVAWIDRSLATPLNAGLRAVRVPAGSSTGTIRGLQSPTGCDVLVDPALAVTAAGTVILAATCITGTEVSPTESRIMLFRSTNGLESFEVPVIAADCPGDTQRCDGPALAASANGLMLAWNEWTLDTGTLTGAGLRVWRSDDDGLTLAEEAVLSGPLDATFDPRLAVGPNADVHLAFSGAFSLGGTTYAAYAKLDTTTAFATPEVLGPGSDPRLTASAQGVYVVWTAGGNTLEEAHDTGSGFTPAGRIVQPSGTTTVVSPSVAADPDGIIHLFWLAQSAAGWSAYYSYSADLGVGWAGSMLMSGPFDGDLSGTNLPHQIGLVDLVAETGGVTLGWNDTATDNAITGVTNVYLAQRVCP